MRRMLTLLGILCLLVSVASPVGSQQVVTELHPGPRAGCPICASRDVYSKFKAANPTTNEAKLGLIRTLAPKITDAQRAVNFLDRLETLGLGTRDVPVDPDVSAFRAFYVRFTPEDEDPPFAIFDSQDSNKQVYAGTDVLEGLKKCEALVGSAQRAYIVPEGMSFRGTDALEENVTLYGLTNPNSKLALFNSDVYFPNSGEVPIRFGAPFFAPRARFKTFTEVPEEAVRGRFKTELAFTAGERDVSLEASSPTRSVVTNFLEKMKAFFSRTPEASIARGVNASRISRALTIKYKEATMSRFVQDDVHSIRRPGRILARVLMDRNY